MQHKDKSECQEKDSIFTMGAGWYAKSVIVYAPVSETATLLFLLRGGKYARFKNSSYHTFI